MDDRDRLALYPTTASYYSDSLKLHGTFEPRKPEFHALHTIRISETLNYVVVRIGCRSARAAAPTDWRGLPRNTGRKLTCASRGKLTRSKRAWMPPMCH